MRKQMRQVTTFGLMAAVGCVSADAEDMGMKKGHRLLLKSAVENADYTEVTLPIFESQRNGETVWVVATESSDKADRPGLWADVGDPLRRSGRRCRCQPLALFIPTGVRLQGRTPHSSHPAPFGWDLFSCSRNLVTVMPATPQLSVSTSSMTTKVWAGFLFSTLTNRSITPLISASFWSSVTPSRVTCMCTYGIVPYPF